MTKLTSYRATFREHRLLLSLPMVLAVLIAAWFVLGTPKSYVSTASLWIDNSAPSASSFGNGNPGLIPPSTEEQNVLAELLATKSVALAVAHHSLLGPYLAAHPSDGFSPAALLGGGGSLDSRIVAALSATKVVTAVPGPQVLQISYAGPSPAVASSTLNGIVSELQQETGNFSRSYSHDTVAYYKNQLAQATQALATARDQLNVYQSQHPTARADDPNVSALTTAVANARVDLATASANLSGATGATNGAASGLTVQVIDSASTPLGPTSGKKKILEGILGGLLAGALISFLGAIALTRGNSDPWEDELAAGRARIGEMVSLPGATVASADATGASTDATAASANGRSTPSGKPSRRTRPEAAAVDEAPLSSGKSTRSPKPPRRTLPEGGVVEEPTPSGGRSTRSPKPPRRTLLEAGVVDEAAPPGIDVS